MREQIFCGKYGKAEKAGDIRLPGQIQESGALERETVLTIIAIKDIMDS